MASLHVPLQTMDLPEQRPALTTNRSSKPQHAHEDDGAPLAVRLRNTYRRARAVVQETCMTAEDIDTLSDKFWAFHTSNVDVVTDTAVTTILSIHWNLCMGTIVRYLADRPQLRTLMQKLENFDTCGEFMLTEVGHGLDARNIETTATLNDDGSFDLHTPTLAAAKIMPPTSPLIGMPRVAVVFARLIVNGEPRSTRPFVVDIHDARTMAPGVTSRLLPPKPGSKVVDHSVTSFNHVRLEAFALLGQLEEPENVRRDFMKQIERVTVGTLSLSMTNIGCLRTSAYILARYSQRRHVAGRKPGERIPIISFTTQHRPILLALTYASVLEQFAAYSAQAFKGLPSNDPARGAFACVFKQSAIHWSQSTLSELVDRCGWQGLYAHNQIIELLMAQRGNSIAEGDIMVLCIRLVAELMLGRYSLPPPRDPSRPLALYEAALWSEATDAITSLASQGQSYDESFKICIMPRCRQLVQATGQRMAFEAAEASGQISADMLSLFETTCMLEEPSWYASATGMSRAAIFKQDSEVVQALLPRLEELLAETNAAKIAQAPIMKESNWMDFVESLPVFESAEAEMQDSSADAILGLNISFDAISEQIIPNSGNTSILSRL